jgi:glyoxylase-like metal-dependent hydrolase (beta-lactamase superfamily II)
LNRPVIEEVAPNLYRVEVPLPNNPLKATNSYIIKGEPRNLIIDTGMNRKECMDALSAALQQLEIELNRTDFFITHLHADHSGLVSELATGESRIYFNRPDAEIILNKHLWQELYQVAIKHGFTEEELRDALEKHPGNKYSPKGPVELAIVSDGDPISAGGYNLCCVQTPGHTPGHMCLYEPERKLFISGDHILGDITPNISSWDDLGNPLRDYTQSLDKVYTMEIDLVLPGHRSVVTDCQKRIDELKAHHRERLEEVLQILKETGAGSAYRIASGMHWDIVADQWEAFPIMQKWFATGEAIAHLKYLEDEGLVERKQDVRKIIFSPI